jgi:hypothetical protein
VLDGGFVALGRPRHGLLLTPAAGAQQAADMIGVVGDTPLSRNHLGNALGGPDIAPEAEGLGSARKQDGQLRFLLLA